MYAMSMLVSNVGVCALGTGPNILHERPCRSHASYESALLHTITHENEMKTDARGASRRVEQDVEGIWQAMRAGVANYEPPVPMLLIDKRAYFLTQRLSWRLHSSGEIPFGTMCNRSSASPRSLA